MEELHKAMREWFDAYYPKMPQWLPFFFMFCGVIGMNKIMGKPELHDRECILLGFVLWSIQSLRKEKP